MALFAKLVLFQALGTRSQTVPALSSLFLVGRADKQTDKMPGRTRGWCSAAATWGGGRKTAGAVAVIPTRGRRPQRSPGRVV